MKLIGLIFALAVAPAVAADGAIRDIEPDCPVLVKFTLQTYDGPIVIEDVCLTENVYADGLLRIGAREHLGDWIFRNGFDPAP